MIFRNLLTLILLLFTAILSGCDQENTEGDLIFREEVGLYKDDTLQTINSDTPDTVRPLNWHNSDYHDELGSINLGYKFSYKKLIEIYKVKSYIEKGREPGAPIIHDNVMFIIDANLILTALNLETKKAIWSINIRKALNPNTQFLGNIIKSSLRQGFLSYGHSSVFVTLNNGRILRFNAYNGRLIWKTHVRAPCRSPFKYNTGKLYGINVINQTIALDANNGQLLWRHEGPYETHSTLHSQSILILDNIIISSNSHGSIYGLHKETGRVLWNHNISYASDLMNIFSTHDMISTPLPIMDKFIVAAGLYGEMIMIKHDTGEILWTKPYGSRSKISATNNFMFFIDHHYRLVCVHLASGNIKWIRQLRKEINIKAPHYITDGSGYISHGIQYIGPIMVEYMLMIMDMSGLIYIIDPNTGDITEQTKLNIITHRYPLFVNDNMYIMDNYKGRILMVK